MTDAANTESTTTETTETAADDLSTTETTDTSTETGTETDTAEQDSRPEPEARKYRKRAQDAEAERDTLRTRLDAMLKVEASRVIEAEPLPLHNPADLFEFGGVTVTDLQDDHGLIDPAKVTAALDSLRTTRGYLFTARRGTDIGQGSRDQITNPTSWQKALRR